MGAIDKAFAEINRVVIGEATVGDLRMAAQALAREANRKRQTASRTQDRYRQQQTLRFADEISEAAARIREAVR